MLPYQIEQYNIILKQFKLKRNVQYVIRQIKPQIIVLKIKTKGSLNAKYVIH